MATEGLTSVQAAEYAKTFLIDPASRSLNKQPDSSSPDEFVGAVTVRGLELFLELNGIKGSQRRELATQTFGMLMKGELNQEIFRGQQYGLGVEVTRSEALGNAVIARRTDLSQEEAIDRYLRHEAALDETVRDKRALEQSKKPPVIKESKKQKSKKEKLPQKEKGLVVPERVNITAYQAGTPEESKVILLNDAKKDIDPNKSILELDDLTLSFQDPSLHFLDPTDIRVIFETGITRDQLRRLFPRFRQAFLKTSKEVEGMAATVAKKLFDQMQEKGEKNIYVITSSQRFLAPIVLRALEELFPDDPVDHNNNQEPKHTSPDVISGTLNNDLLDRWSNRFDPWITAQYKQLFRQSGNPLAADLIKLSQHPDQMKVLNQEGSIELGGRTITLDNVDQLLLPVMITDELLIRAVFTDLLGDIYHRPFLTQGSEQVSGLFALKVLENNFTLKEIENLLSPVRVRSNGLSRFTVGGVQQPEDIRTRLRREIQALIVRTPKPVKEKEIITFNAYRFLNEPPQRLIVSQKTRNSSLMGGTILGSRT